MKHSKRYREEQKKMSSDQNMTLDAALAALCSVTVKFDPSVEFHLHLGIDPKKAEHIVRGTLQMPHGTGKTKRIIAFVPPHIEQEAKDAGADLIGTKEVIAKIAETKKCDFDIAVAHPQVMRDLARIAKIIGQKGLMPSPKTETVGPNISSLIHSIKKGKTAFRNDDSGNLHFHVGKCSFPPAALKENIESALRVVKKLKPEDCKGQFIKTMTVCSSMGPGIRIKI